MSKPRLSSSQARRLYETYFGRRRSVADSYARRASRVPIGRLFPPTEPPPRPARHYRGAPGEVRPSAEDS
jgi:hypothetical protein